MRERFAWRKLRDPELAGEVDSLRADSLRLLLGATAVGYLLWHIASVVSVLPDGGLSYWTLFLVVAPGLTATYSLLSRGSPLAYWCFLIASVVAITAAVGQLAAPPAALLYPVVALAAVVLVSPVAGLAVSAVSAGLLWWLRMAGPLAFVPADRLVEVAVASLLIVGCAWALDRNMVTAVEWALHSYEQARRNTQAAQAHRAQLVQALRQLDTAYYRLERANSALELARKAAEAAERAKSEFVTNISHELRTPLNLIVGFSEMVVTSPESYGEPLPASYRGDLNAIYRSAQHLLTLIDDVLDLARVGVGRMALIREPVDLGLVVSGACDIVREYIAAKGLYLNVTLPAEPLVLDIDRLRIRQVLLNLLTNAVRFTERGGITVSVAAEGERAVVRVADTGRGIAASDLPRLFREFESLDGEASRRQTGFGGTGLGLPLSRRLVELHGGQMGVESTLGSGATFWLTLPIAPVDGVATGDGWRPVRLPGLPTGERVLVLAGGDNQLARFLQRHLRGYRIVAAPDWPGAVATAVELRALAILADPTVVGQTSSPEPPVPVIRLPLPHGDRIASELGVAAYLMKPITRQQLRTAVERLGRPIRTVLVVDDDPRFVRLVNRILRAPDNGEERIFLAAHTGEEALTIMAETRPDVVLLDLAMAGITGEEVLARMVADARLAGIPVIVITGKEQLEWQLPLLEPISAAKPNGFRVEELLTLIEALLGALEPPRQYPTGGSGSRCSPNQI